MVVKGPKDGEMRFMLLQESVWNNGDRLSRVLEHVIAHESRLVRLEGGLEVISQKLESRTNGMMKDP